MASSPVLKPHIDPDGDGTFDSHYHPRAEVDALIADKADQTALDTANAILTSKADQGDLDALGATVAANTSAVALKSNQTDLDTTNATVGAHSAAIARVDPGTTGAVGQSPTIGPSGPAWLTDPVFNVKHPRFGAKGNGASDATSIAAETAAVQAAINAATAAGRGVILFPAGSYRISGVTVAIGNITFRGVGRDVSTLLTTSGDLITLTGATNFVCEDMTVRSATGGGHVFVVTDSINHGLWHNISAVQNNPGKSVLQADDGGAGTLNYIDNLWWHCETTHTNTATVPTFNLRGGAINRNAWRDMRPNNSGNYTWLIETTAVSSYASNNRIEDITGEVLDGGVAKLLGCKGTTLSNIGIYDTGKAAGGTTKDLIVLGNSTVTTTLATQYTTLISCQRVGGTLGSGLYDLVEGSTTSSTMIVLINCGGPTLLAYNAGHHRGIVIGGNVTATSGENLVLHPLTGTSTYPGQVRVGSLGVGNAVAATTPGSVAKKIEVFDAAGVSLGFVPVYSTIT